MARRAAARGVTDPWLPPHPDDLPDVAALVRLVRRVVLAELAALVDEALPDEGVDYATACARLLDLTQRRQLALIRGALPLAPLPPLEEYRS